MVKNKIEYKELSKARISASRNAVVSVCSKSGFTIAQQLEVREGEKTTSVFMKGALHVDDVQGLYNLRDALNMAIKIADEDNAEADEDDCGWDEE